MSTSTDVPAAIVRRSASFIASGPNAARVSVVTRDEEAKEPIRVFASVASDRNLEETKNLVLAEMDRTKAWERKALLVVTSTSTGFVNEWAAESFEYLMHGDSAIITMQYSTLPSALGLLTARDQPPKVGRLLFKAVAAKVASLPQDQRPKLYAGGESLGDDSRRRQVCVSEYRVGARCVP